MKPTSKAISVSTGEQNDYFTTTIVCEDGSVWEHIKDGGDSFWDCILEAPTQPKSDLPEVGSRWRDKKDHNYQLTVQEGICFTDNTSNLGYNLRVEDFLNDYEPIPTQSDNKE